MVAWTAQVDQKLLIVIVKHMEKPIPYGEIASELVAMGVAKDLTAKAVSRHLDKLKADVASGKIPSSTDGNHADKVAKMVADAAKLTKSVKKNAGMPTTPEKKAKASASASSTPANTEKKRKRVLDDIGFRAVTDDTPMQDESPAKRLLPNSAAAGERSQGPLSAGTADEMMGAGAGGSHIPFYEDPVTPFRTKAHSPLLNADDDDDDDDENIDYMRLIDEFYSK